MFRFLQIVLTTFLLFCSTVQAQSYTFTKIVDSLGDLFQFQAEYSINSSGAVAFEAAPKSTMRRGIYTGSGGAVRGLYTGEGIVPDQAFPSSFNDAGRALFFGFNASGDEQGLFTSAGDGATAVVRGTGFVPAAAGASINNQGQVAFCRSLGTNRLAVFAGLPPAEPVQVAEFTSGCSVAINNNGDLVYSGVLASGSARVSMRSGTTTSIVAESNTSLSPSGSRIAINDRGEVALSASGGGILDLGIYVTRNGASKLVAGFLDVASPALSLSLNNRGEVALVGARGADLGIFLAGGSLDKPVKVIGRGDSLFGFSVASVLVPGYGTDFLNDSGQIVFAYTLVNGVTGIAVASPAGAATPSLDAGSPANGATYGPGLVPGSWAQVKGSNLSATTRIWQAGDFQGQTLPVSLDGIEVKINNISAAVYYISPTQISFQVPSGVLGSVSIQTLRNGIPSNNITATVVESAPGIFEYTAGGKRYPSAIYGASTLIVGDPAQSGAGVRRAQVGDRIQLFATGFRASPSGTATIPSDMLSAVTATVADVPATVEFAGLVGVGLFQINIVVPAVAAGDHPLVIRYNGKSSQTGVVVPVQ